MNTHTYTTCNAHTFTTGKVVDRHTAFMLAAQAEEAAYAALQDARMHEDAFIVSARMNAWLDKCELANKVYDEYFRGR